MPPFQSPYTSFSLPPNALCSVLKPNREENMVGVMLLEVDKIGLSTDCFNNGMMTDKFSSMLGIS